MAIGVVRLQGARVKAVKADLLKNEATLTFTVSLDDQMMEAKRDLGIMEFEKQTVNLIIEEQQMRLFKTRGEAEAERQGEDDAAD